MALSPRLELKHTQSLVMTPQLQQAIKLLQYSNLELTDFISREVEKNPLLEMGEYEGGDPTGEGRERQEAGDNTNLETPRDSDRDSALIETDKRLNADGAQNETNDAPLDTDYENVYNSDSFADSVENNSGLSMNGTGSIQGGGGSFSRDSFDFQENLAEAVTLKDHLKAQLNMTRMSVADSLIAHFLIDMVNDAGYLTDDISIVSEKLGCIPEDVERVLSELQSFDPVGVFARDLAECLALQLAELDRLDPSMQTLLENLDLLAKRDLPTLRRACKVDAEDLHDMINEIQALNPKPGNAFGGGSVQEVVPDVFLREKPKGGWAIEVNNDNLPRVLVNTRYYAEVSGQAQSKDDKAFLTECYQSANWLVKALDQRARTILKVTTELVRQQEEFFLHGIRYLKPLNLRTIAEAIEMHESTVSRVTANKYLATPRGVFEMKYFFTSAIASSVEGDVHSAESVKQRIKDLIDAESPKSILSDDKIVEILVTDKIDIARRTVAKYREALGISSSIQRRRIKNMGL